MVSIKIVTLLDAILNNKETYIVFKAQYSLTNIPGALGPVWQGARGQPGGVTSASSYFTLQGGELRWMERPL